MTLLLASSLILLNIVSLASLFGWGRLLGDKITNYNTLNIGQYLFLGIFVSIFSAQLIHIFIALDRIVTLIWLVGGLCILIYKYFFSKTIKIERLTKLSFFYFIIIILISTGLSSSGVSSYDSGLYHIQSIKWLQSDNIIIGIANLHSRLAFNQSYFTFAAIISPFHSPLLTQAITNTIILFSALASIHPKKKFNTLLSNKPDINIVYVLSTIIILLIFIPREISSLSPDFMLNIVMIISFLFYASYLLDTSNNDQTNIIGFIIILLSLLPTIKLSSLAFAVVAGLILLYKAYFDSRVENRKLIVPIILGSLLLVTFIIRNILYSGCLLYPLENSCLPLEWTLPHNLAIHIEETITSWARWPGHTKDEALLTYDWLYPWLERFFSNKLVIITNLIIIFSFLIAREKYPTLKKDISAILLAPTLVGITTWFYKAPDIRFAKAYFVILIIMAFTTAIYSINKNKNSLRKKYIYTVFILILVPYLGQIRYLRIMYNFSEIPIPKTTTLTTHGGQNILVPYPYSTDQCWDSNLPCTPRSEFKSDMKFTTGNYWTRITLDRMK